MIFPIRQPMFLFTVNGIALALVACGDSDGSTNPSGTIDTSGDTSSLTMESSATSSNTASTGVSQTSGEVTSSTTLSTTTEMTENFTSDGNTTEGKDSCQLSCEVLTSCQPGYTMEACLTECVPPVDTPECVAAFDAYNFCIALLNCDELFGDSCDEEYLEIEQACSGRSQS